MHRFFLPPGALVEGATVALDDYAHQLHAVLRLQPGAPLLLLDGSGLEFDATLTTLGPRHAGALVAAGRPSRGEPRLAIILFVATLKADKFEWVLQKGTELGVRRFVPVVTRRSVARPAAALAPKLPRWQNIVREAAEQARRGRLPRVEPPLDFGPALALAAPGPRLLAWEESATQPPATHVRPATIRSASGRGEEISLLVGPEGGFDVAEVEQAQAAGWQVVSLGARTLRAETASLAAVAALLALAGELGSFGAQFSAQDPLPAAAADVQPVAEESPVAEDTDPRI